MPVQGPRCTEYGEPGRPQIVPGPTAHVASLGSSRLVGQPGFRLVGLDARLWRLLQARLDDVLRAGRDKVKGGGNQYRGTTLCCVARP